MILTDEIREWAIKRELHNGNSDRQVIKLVEEVGELANAYNKENDAELEDALGDIYVVLTILAMQLGYQIEMCVKKAYNEIKDREGTMKNGVFVKKGD